MELTFKPFKLKAASGDTTLTFRAFQGSMRITINEGTKMVFDRSIPDDRWIFIRNCIVKALNISPGQKIVLVFSKYNTETKKSDHDWVMTILKDERQCFSISTEWAGGGKYIFPIKGPYNLALGSDPMPDGERSALGLETLIDFVKNISPLQKVLSNGKEYWTKMMEQGKGKGNSGRPNYAPRQGGNGGSQPQASAPESAGDDEASYF